MYVAESVPVELIDAARIDRADELRVFWQIVVPTMRSAIVTRFPVHPGRDVEQLLPAETGWQQSSNIRRSAADDVRGGGGGGNSTRLTSRQVLEVCDQQEGLTPSPKVGSPGARIRLFTDYTSPFVQNRRRIQRPFTKARH
ncbi:hypothetical protein ALI22I_05275 [Saccharothrix sp. ALI-22-I]|uniref:ABC transporter permease subunit n=1 Tax=Saccharothrix sp. ALI-22-I TaxID=1933778 RepID=UPI00097C4B72|nr:ABC transporter permease subunit [Saccharothrix sp. ALI-22-I]ONI92200.1 hypothetical protein ALI22I_05275 [Saccharothrix sp. ALI-22-I]